MDKIMGRITGRIGILATAILSGTAQGAEPIRIAPLPMENREATVAAFNPVVAYLQEKLKQPVELVYFDKNSQIVSALQEKNLDIAMLGSLPYVSLKQKGVHVEPLVFFKEENGEARYRCALVTFGGEAVSAKSLRGKRMALTQPLSTCGYLGASALLRQYAGIRLEDTQYRYLNTHEAAALAVIGGEAEAASIKDEFAKKFESLGLHTVGFSDWVPAIGLFASRSNLGEQRIAEIRAILLATPPQVYRRWGNSMRYGMVVAADADFDALRKFGDPGSIPTSSKSQ